MVTLRGLQKKDVDGMLEWMHDPQISANFRRNLNDIDEESALTFINNARIKPTEGGSIHYAIVDETDEYLGTISLKEIDLESKNAELAISLRQKAQGKGIAADAMRQLLKIAFEEILLVRIYLNVLSENERAIRLYERCGFEFEGEFRDHLFLNGEYKSLKWYAVLKERYVYKYQDNRRECG